MKNTLIIAFLFLNLSIFGQKRTKEKLPSEQSPNLKLSYFGNWNYPGIKLGSEFMLRNVQINPKKGRNARVKQSFLTINASLYDHYEFRTNLMLNAEYLIRKNYINGIFAEFAPGVGYSKSLSKVVPTYKENTDGTLSVVKPNNSYTMISLLGGVGYDFSKKQNLPIKAYFRTGVQLNSYEVFFYTVPITEIGIITSFSKLKRTKK